MHIGGLYSYYSSILHAWYEELAALVPVPHLVKSVLIGENRDWSS